MITHLTYLSKRDPVEIIVAAYTASPCHPDYSEEWTPEPLKRPEEYAIGIERGLNLNVIRGRQIGLGLRLAKEGVLVYLQGMKWAFHTDQQTAAFVAAIDAEQVRVTNDGLVLRAAA